MKKPLTLVVSDGRLARTNTVMIDVMTTARAVSRLMDLANTEASKPQPLRATLAAALASLDRGNPTSAVNQLQAFQNKVVAQVSPIDPAMAATFVEAAQQVIDALSGASLKGKTHGRLIAVRPSPCGRVQMQVATGTSPCIIEASSNLLDWEMFGVAAPAANGVSAIEDRQSGASPQRFYRVFEPQSP
jgi:hypothetical protein